MVSAVNGKKTIFIMRVIIFNLIVYNADSCALIKPLLYLYVYREELRKLLKCVVPLLLESNINKIEWSHDGNTVP